MAVAPLLAATLTTAGVTTAGVATASAQTPATELPAAATAAIPMNLEVYLGSYYTWLPYIAAAKGFFARNGIDAKVIGLTSGGSVAFAGLANGSADVAMGDLSLAGPLLEKGVGLTAISGDVKAGWELVAPKGSTVPSGYPAGVKSLKGKPVGVVALGSSSYYYLQQVAVGAGIGQNGVAYTALGGTVAGAVSALEGNRVAAAMVSPDAAYYLVHDQGDKLVYNTGSNAQLKASGRLLASLVGKPLGGMWARNGWLSAHPGAAVKFQHAMDEADVWMHKPGNLTQVISVLQQEKDLATFESGPGAKAFFAYALPQIVAYVPAGSAQANMNFWVKTGLLAKALPVKTWYSSTIPTSEAAVVAVDRKAGSPS